MLKIKNLSKAYGNTTIIQNLNMKIQKGQKVCLFAPSGTGKTTLINIINGLIDSYSGQIINEAKSISTIFQAPDLFWYKTVRENILFPLKIKDIEFDDELKEYYESWLEITDLKQHENHYPHELSGGMKQKVALARGFIFNPDLVLLDEPFNSIDIRAKDKSIRFILDNYPKSTFLFVTHTIEDIPKIADKIFLFREDMLSGFQEIKFSKEEKLSTIIKKIFEEIY
ncbi:MAG TPA: ATP-binding cassette domain-containing protein [bacterium]|nr:ATP-binding cassette domain-containing protein [bacterium]